MFTWFGQALGNISVKLKLGLGFGLVLLLTVLIALSGLVRSLEKRMRA